MSALRTPNDINYSSTANCRCFLVFKQNSLLLFMTIFSLGMVTKVS